MITRNFAFLSLLALSAGSARCDDVFINEVMYHPSSENPLEAYIELGNKGTNMINLTGWHFKKGVDYTFPTVSLAPGALIVVAANLAAFQLKYPSVSNVVGGWSGTLSHTDEEIALDDAFSNQVDSVHYASSGDWSTRSRGLMDHNHQGWSWAAAHDGGGKSLELVNPSLPNKLGQNWSASITAQGTPGRPNSVVRTNTAPLILEVTHFPVIPKSTDSVTVTAHLIDERTNGLSAILYYRLDGAAAFSSTPMLDNGAHADGLPNDGYFGASLPARPNHSIVEFYVESRDLEGNLRTWPAAVQPAATQSANLLYQVSDIAYTGAQPLYLLLMTESERAELDYLGNTLPDALSDAEMNGTFISVDELGSEVHHTVGIRNRGHGSRTARPNNYHVSFPSDNRWKGVHALVLNTQSTHAQVAGSVLFKKAGIPAPFATPVQVRVNNTNLAMAGSPQFGSYVALESMDSDLISNHFPDDSSGNLYAGKAADSPSTAEADLVYRGTNRNSYTNVYFKNTNKSDDQWADLIDLTRVLSATLTNNYQDEVKRVIDVNEWLRYFAINALLDNNESGIYMGFGDDYSIYRGTLDPRFRMVPHDLDTIMGQGGGPGTTNAGIFRAADLVVLERLLKGPEFLPLYYAHLRGMIETTFSESEMNPILQDALGGFVPTNTISQMEGFNADRISYVLPLLPHLVSVTNSWKYNQSGSDLGTLWREPGYNDTGWPAGPGLFYNETAPLPAPKRTPLNLGITTYYFRTHFAVSPAFTNVPSGLKIRISTVVDDGAVFYLNGAEVFRLAMPQGPVNSATLASRAVGDAIWEGSFLIATNSLLPGDNVLAVEVHQTDPTSSDVVFGMTLDLTVEPLSTVPSPVLLNEIMAHSITLLDVNGHPADWVELYNKSASPVDISDTSLTDNLNVPRKWAFPASSIIPAHGFLAVGCDGGLPSSSTNTGFSLKSSGDQLYFFDKPVNGWRLLDSISFGLQAADFSIGRVPNGASSWKLTGPTKGSGNIAATLGNPLSLKINEWMANPSAGSDWFELCNLQSNPVELSQLVLSDNPTDRAQSRIPPLSFIGAAAGRFQKFEADGTPSKGASHANFKLSTSGETITLFTSAGTVIDAVTFGVQQLDVSQGRYPDASANIMFFPGSETPGQTNSLAQRQQILRSGNNVLIHFYGYNSLSYTVQYRASVSSGAWTKLQNVFPAANGPVEVVDTIAPGGSTRFYRLVSPAIP